VSVDIDLIAPVAMEKGLRFAIREGGRTIGAGRVSEVIAWGWRTWIEERGRVSPSAFSSLAGSGGGAL